MQIRYGIIYKLEQFSRNFRVMLDYIVLVLSALQHSGRLHLIIRVIAERNETSLVIIRRVENHKLFGFPSSL